MTWQAVKVDFPARKRKVIKVSCTIYPVQLTETTEGPCYAFRFPIRLGRFWARPPSQIDVAVALDESINPDDILLVRPPGVVRSGRKLTLTSEQIGVATFYKLFGSQEIPRRAPRSSQEPPSEFSGGPRRSQETLGCPGKTAGRPQNVRESSQGGPRKAQDALGRSLGGPGRPQRDSRRPRGGHKTAP